MAESFFGRLETELIDRKRVAGPRHASLEAFDFVEGFYNPQRRHSGIEQLAPVEFERKFRQEAGAPWAPGVHGTGGTPFLAPR